MSHLSSTPQTPLVPKDSQKDAIKPTAALTHTLKAKRYNYLFDTPEVAAQRFVDEILKPLWRQLYVNDFDAELTFQDYKRREQRRMELRVTQLLGDSTAAKRIFETLTGGMSFDEMSQWDNCGTAGTEQICLHQDILFFADTQQVFTESVNEIVKAKQWDSVFAIQTGDIQFGKMSLGDVGHSGFGFLNITLVLSGQKLFWGVVTGEQQIIEQVQEQDTQLAGKLGTALQKIYTFMNHDWYHNLTLLRFPGSDANFQDALNVGITLPSIPERERNALKFSADMWQEIFEQFPHIRQGLIQDLLAYEKLCQQINDPDVRQYFMRQYAFAFGRIVDPRSDHRLVVIDILYNDLFAITNDSGLNEKKLHTTIYEKGYGCKLPDGTEVSHEDLLHFVRDEKGFMGSE